jgi:phosphopantothenoylcysteine decarboxylase/phosphopantothenate--cysteine ligase
MEMGASVKVIAANVDQSLLQGIEHTNVLSTFDLSESVKNAIGSFDLLVMAAAVADYRPTGVSEKKIKRAGAEENIQISLTANPDIVAAVSEKTRSAGLDAVIVAFAAESGDDLESLAREKLHSKKCDFVVANSITSGEVFGSDQNSVVLVSENESTELSGSKLEIAKAVLKIVSSKVVRLPRGVSK